MNTLEVLKKRRSIREYADKPIPKKVLEEIIDCARYAPTARNVQPWEFVVVTGKPALERLAGLCEYGKFIAQAGACILVLCEDTKYYLEDGVAATENVLLAAAHFGVGSCWVAGDKKPYGKDVLKLVGAPAKMKLVSVLSLGYPKSKAEFKLMKKRALKGMLRWEKY
ncbi:MAG TPA: nitroreductase family protein [Elusimicrobia bacterium]|nr:nitroreductase family protein [Elusimicrobiota bacterium]